MFEKNEIDFIKKVMTAKALDESTQAKTIDIEVEKALKVVEKIDPHSNLRQQITDKINNTEESE